MAFADIMNEDERLVILRVLAEDTGGYSANESIIHSILGEFAHKVSRDKVRTQLSWLSEQGLVTLRDVAGCMVATLTSRGIDVASGLAIVPGVKRPRPKD
jgi:DNA-binding transcriptional ArsR family regulator